MDVLGGIQLPGKSLTVLFAIQSRNDTNCNRHEHTM